MKEKCVIYYLPVKKEFLEKWVYYNVDLQILQSIYKEVFICNNTIDIVKYIFKSDHIFCWWWHQSFIPLILSKIFNKKILVTGAIHMFDYSGALDFIFCCYIIFSRNINFFILHERKKKKVSSTFNISLFF